MENKQYNSAEIAQIIKATAKERHISAKQMLDEIGLAKGTLDNFKTSMPKADNLAKIADYLDVSVDFLLGRKKNNASEDDLRSVIIEKVRALTDEQAQKLLVLLETLFSEAE